MRSILARYLLMLPLLFTGGTLCSQSEGDRLRAYMEQAEAYWEEENLEAALENYQFAGNLLRNIPDWERYCKVLNRIGEIHLGLSEFNDAEVHIKRSLEFSRKHLDEKSLVLAEAYDLLGYILAAKARTDFDYEDIIENLEKAYEIRNSALNGRGEEVVESLVHMAEWYDDIEEDSDMALELLDKAFAIVKSDVGEDYRKAPKSYARIISEAYSMMGFVQLSLGEYEECLKAHLKAKEICDFTCKPNSLRTAECLENLESYYKANKIALDYRQANLEKALTIKEGILNKFNLFLSESYFRMGNIFTEQGDYDNALLLFERAADIMVKVYGGKNHKNIAYVYSLIARCHHSRKNYEAEFPYLLEALEIQKRLLPDDHTELADTYTNLGIYYGDQGDSIAYVDYFQKALDIWLKSAGEISPGTAVCYANLGKAYSAKGDWAMAKRYLDKSREIRLTMNKGNEYDPKMAKLYHTYGMFHLKFNEHNEALAMFQKGLMALVKDFREPDLRVNPDFTKESVVNLGALLEMMEGKGDALYGRYQYKGSMNTEDLETAYKTGVKALDVVDSLRTEILSNSSKQERTERSIHLYEHCIVYAKELHGRTGDEKYLREAFLFSERSKVFLMLEAIRESEKLSDENLPDSIRIRDNNYKAEISRLEGLANIAKKRDDPDAQKAYQKQLLELNNEYEKFKTTTLGWSASNLEEKTKGQVASVDEIRKKILKPNSAFIEYFWGSEKVYFFTITKSKLQLFSVNRTEELETNLEGFRASMSNYNTLTDDVDSVYQLFTSSSHSCYQQLIEPAKDALQGIQKLVVVPDGPFLGGIPFEALIQELPKQNNFNTFSNLKYLLKDFTISYSYSGSLLLDVAGKTIRHSSRNVAFIPSYKINSDAQDAEKAKTAPLKWAVQEVSNVNKHFKLETYSGTEASERKFKEVVSNPSSEFNIVHLAMHGLSDMESPNNSFLYFTFNPKDTIEDNSLYVYEMSPLKVKAEMVVLSACETGLGKYTRGEGIMSLARSFILAGSQSVITTLWKVNDQSTSSLMSHFYKNLSKGMAKDEALREAKLSFIMGAGRGQSHPAFWAGFICIGKTDKLPSNPYKYWFLGGAALIALAGFLAYRRSA